ncbi:NAD(P)H-hydrate dehydratase [Roseomonas marmotae]|uniref:ADP-dependent (S)-NAD(P)H-hydrate dehydratase n=1 Tax=Roseomonas marmotae TaxID=2768161 RepID=A0ABS3K769_9PROT|nr:NAD(P)H-hydrate dehydratase [Roseomonas marmotae]MBO1073312.1 NAD(P)H-hydrate dehydratase [Roseomonas marmotae]QTI79071.1 NAD(P)H-hydrate dehydratase [Roseomonas marmotae]
MSGETPVTEALLRGMPLPQHHDGDDKNARGGVLVVGGCLEVPGAVLLAGIAALRTGAGRLQMASCASLAPSMGIALPEARVFGLPETEDGQIAPAAASLLGRRGGRARALALGPGMMEGPESDALTVGLLRSLSGPALVLDAAALAALPREREALRRHAGRVVITPHDGEMAGLLGITREEVMADPLSAARHAAAMLQVVVVMKGGCTRIVTPQGDAWSCDQGNVGLATSGSGDVLSGIVAGLLAQGATPLQAALWGVYTHGEAGRRLAEAQGLVGYLARELPGEVPSILADLA